MDRYYLTSVDVLVGTGFFVFTSGHHISNVPYYVLSLTMCSSVILDRKNQASTYENIIQNVTNKRFFMNIIFSHFRNRT